MFIKLSEWAVNNKYSYIRAWQLFKEGKIPNARQTTTGRVVIDVPKTLKPQCWAVYARVSNSSRRTTDLERQAERLVKWVRQNNSPVGPIIKDVGSGLNDQRPKLLKLLRNPDITHLVVEHKDRLARFGVEYINEICKCRSIELVIVNEAEDDKHDLMEDFVSIVTSFCARLYGQRRSINHSKLFKDYENFSNKG